MASPEQLSPIEHPRCPRCRRRMTLTWRTTADAKTRVYANHTEKRVFECAKCNSTAMVMALDPLKSGALGWLSGELGRKD
jgi:hypothetical protein